MLISLTLVKWHGILLLCEQDSESPALQVTQVKGPSSLFPTTSPACTQPAHLEGDGPRHYRRWVRHFNVSNSHVPARCLREPDYRNNNVSGGL